MEGLLEGWRMPRRRPAWGLVDGGQQREKEAGMERAGLLAECARSATGGRGPHHLWSGAICSGTGRELPGLLQCSPLCDRRSLENPGHGVHGSGLDAGRER
jgi:hypothetical protein